MIDYVTHSRATPSTRLCGPRYSNISAMPSSFLASFSADDVDVLVDFIDGVQVEYGSNVRLDGLISFEVKISFFRYHSYVVPIPHQVKKKIHVLRDNLPTSRLSENTSSADASLFLRALSFGSISQAKYHRLKVRNAP